MTEFISVCQFIDEKKKVKSHSHGRYSGLDKGDAEKTYSIFPLNVNQLPMSPWRYGTF